jgi:hypothetical protein
MAQLELTFTLTVPPRERDVVRETMSLFQAAWERAGKPECATDALDWARRRALRAHRELVQAIVDGVSI